MTTNPFPTIPTCTLQQRRPLSRPEWQRALGAAIGAVVGDALGAPFEFGPAGAYSTAFPTPVHGASTEMTGGGAFRWGPGEFTDDSQMAVLLGESLAAVGGYDPDHVWSLWRAWARSAADVGVATRRALGHDDWRSVVHGDPDRTAGNGALMRSAFLALALLDHDADTVRNVVLHQSALTHHHPDAGWGAWIAVVAIHAAIRGTDPFARIDAALDELPADTRTRFEEFLAPGWTPASGGRSNGSVWGCLAQAVWAVRNHGSYAEAVTAAIDLGGDTDTVATVAGALAGAIHGIQGIPARWSTVVNGRLPDTDGDRTIGAADLNRLVRRLLGKNGDPSNQDEPLAGPGEVAPGLHAANRLGAYASPDDWAVVSLCDTGDRFAEREARLQVYLIDKPGDANLSVFHAVRDAVDAIDAFLAEGRQVVVHCHGGHSRTGLVLRAWYMRANGATQAEAHDWLDARWDQYRTWEQEFTDFLETVWVDSDHGRR